MNWKDAETELEELEAAHEQGRDVAAQAHALLARVQGLADGRGTPQNVDVPRKDAGSVATKAKLVMESMCLGSLALPEQADDRLSELAAAFAPQIIGESLVEAFKRAIDDYCKEAEGARERVKALEEDVAQGRSRTQVLEAYCRLMDVLQGSGAELEEPQ